MNKLPSWHRSVARLSLFCALALTVLFSSTHLTLIGSAQNREDPKCLTTSAIMEAEVNDFIKVRKIRLRSGPARFQDDGKVQALALFTRERVNLRGTKPIENVIAVIGARYGRGQSTFYVVEQAVKKDGITYTIKRGGRTAQVIKANFGPGQPGGGSVTPKICKDLQDQAETTLASLVPVANQTCMTLLVCLDICVPADDPNAIASTLFFVPPTSWRCRVRNATLSFAHSYIDMKALVEDDDEVVPGLVDAAIRNQAALFAPSMASRR